MNEENNSERTIAVVSAGLGSPSATRLLADKMAVAAVSSFARAGVTARTRSFELRDYAQDVTNNLLTGFAPKRLEEMIAEVTGADGVIFTTPVFSTSYSGLFKSFIDVLDPESLIGMPVMLGANAGTPRHSLAIDYAMRPLFTYLKANPVPTGVFAAADDWGGIGSDGEGITARAERAAAEFSHAVLTNSSLDIVVAPEPKIDIIVDGDDQIADENTSLGGEFAAFLRSIR